MQFVGTFTWDKFTSNGWPFYVKGLPDVLYHRGSSCSLEEFLVFQHLAIELLQISRQILVDTFLFLITALILGFGLWWKRISSFYNSHIQVIISMLICHAHLNAVTLKGFPSSLWIIKRQHPERCFLGLWIPFVGYPTPKANANTCMVAACIRSWQGEVSKSKKEHRWRVDRNGNTRIHNGIIVLI